MIVVWLGRIVLCAASVALSWTIAAQGVAPMEEQAVPRQRGITITAGIDVPLMFDAADLEGEETQGEASMRSPRISLALRYTPVERWYARVTLHHYLDEARQAPWHPDFTYGFGYDDWRPGTLSVFYDNYGGNRFSADRDRGERFTRVEEGTISAVYKIPIPRGIESIFVTHPDNRLSASLGYHVTPRFRREGQVERDQWKQSVSLGVRHRVYRWWYVEGRAFWYPIDGHQQPWDPDYTYGFGYFDWHPGRISIQYNNYSAHRWPGKDGGRGGSFREGAITISWTGSW